MCKALGVQVTLSDAAVTALTRYPWSGDARELHNVLERAPLIGGGGVILPAHLQLPETDADLATDGAQPRAEEIAAGSASQGSAPEHLKRVERALIAEALARNGNNKAATARDLGLSLSTLKRRITEHGL